MTATLAPAGLEGLEVGRTSIGEVRGTEGLFHYRGYDATELAGHQRLEAVAHLLLFGELPDPAEERAFADELRAARETLPDSLLERLPSLLPSREEGDVVAAMRTAWSLAAASLGCRPWVDLSPTARRDDAVALVAVAPILAAGVYRDEPIDPTSLPAGIANAYLTAVRGKQPSPREVAALESYLVLTLDHGLNASTFAARVVTSTGADLGAVLVAGLSALSGPLHGGAPSRALEMLEAIDVPERAEGWVASALSRGERIMGFGHRVYRTEDPRARHLRQVATDLGGPRVELARHVEEVVRRQLREAKPDRVLDVNVEYYAAIVLDAVGVPPELFTPTFAVARSIGWMAHSLEQMEHNRIMRPTARYDGPEPIRPLPARS